MKRGKFKFRLASVKRLRDLDEQKEKVALGKLIQQKKAIELQCQEMGGLIEVLYQKSHELIEQNSTALTVQSFPRELEAMQAALKLKLQEREEMSQLIQQQQQLLQKARAKAKVMNKLEGKERENYLKERKKQLEQKREELSAMFKLFKERNS